METPIRTQQGQQATAGRSTGPEGLAAGSEDAGAAAEAKAGAPSRLFTKTFSAVAAAQLFSLFGDAMLRFALPLYLLNISGSATLYGAVVACAFLPYILLTPLGGAVADRVNKRAIMVVFDLVMAGAALAYLAFAQTADIVVLTIAVLMVLYAAQSIYKPAVQSSVPSIVAPDRIVSATAIVTQVSTLSGLVGPVLGGLVFGFFGITPILAISAAGFLVSSALIAALARIPSVRHASPAAAHPLRALKADIRQAAAFLKTNPVMVKTMVLATLRNGT